MKSKKSKQLGAVQIAEPVVLIGMLTVQAMI